VTHYLCCHFQHWHSTASFPKCLQNPTRTTQARRTRAGAAAGMAFLMDLATPEVCHDPRPLISNVIT